MNSSNYDNIIQMSPLLSERLDNFQKSIDNINDKINKLDDKLNNIYNIISRLETHIISSNTQSYYINSSNGFQGFQGFQGLQGLRNIVSDTNLQRHSSTSNKSN